MSREIANKTSGAFILQAVPRKVWLDKTGKQLIQWPIEEIETLHEKEVKIFDKELTSGSVMKVPDITASQVSLQVHSIPSSQLIALLSNI